MDEKSYNKKWREANVDKCRAYAKQTYDAIRQDPDRLEAYRERKRLWAIKNRKKKRIERIKQELAEYEAEQEMLKNVKK